MQADNKTTSQWHLSDGHTSVGKGLLILCASSGVKFLNLLELSVS